MPNFARMFAAAAFAICASASASAAIIDFNTVPSAPNNGTTFGTITVDGYRFTSPHAHVMNDPLSCAGSCASNGTQYVGGDMTTLTIDMNGAGFSIVSLDFAEAFADFSIPTTLTVNAFFLGGGSSTQAFAFDGIYDGVGALADFQKLSLNLDNLSSLRLSANGFFSIDNVDTGGSTQVPEPAVLSLLAFGLAGLSLSRRRK